MAAIALAAGGVFALLLLGPGLVNSTPRFSSLRTDPQGTSVLFGALQRAGLRVERGYDPAALAELAPKSTVAFVLAPLSWPDGLADALTSFAKRGGRVIVAQPPQPALNGPEVDWGYAELQDHSLKLTGPWSPLLASTDDAGDLATRSLGRGSVVVATEAEFASNHELADLPDTDLLATLLDGRSTVWVDESGHGLEPARGLAWLLRRYRLQLALVLVFTALALLVWSLASTLERPPLAESQSFVELPESAFDGYVRLLRRALTEEELNHELSRRS